MTTHRTLSWTFRASPEAVLRRCADPQVARARAQADPNLQAQVTQLATDTADGAVLVVEMTGAIPRGWLPAKVSSAMGEGPRITRREAWYLAEDGGAYADVRFRFDNVPATSMTGSARLAPRGADASELTYRLELDIAIPMLGSMIENAVLAHVAGAFDKEAHVIQSH